MKLFDRVELLIDTNTVPRGCRGIVVDVLEPDGCFVEFFDDNDNTIDVLPLDQADLALVQLIDRDAVRAGTGRVDWQPRDQKSESDRRLDVTSRCEASAGARRDTKRVDNVCSECGTTDCSVLEPERVALDMAKLHAILDYVLGEDPRASIHIRRGRDNELMVQVECDDGEIADRINFSRECNLPGIWFGASERECSREALARTNPELTLAQYLLSAPRCDELDIERSRELPGPDPFAESRDDSAASTTRSGGPSDKLESLARDYMEGRADASEVLAEMESAQMNRGPEDD